MANVLEKDFDVSNHFDIIGGRKNISDFDTENAIENVIKRNESKEDLSPSFEDSRKFLDEFFSGRKEVIYEKWDKVESIHGKISHIDEDEVYIDCMIDMEKRVIQHRVFPIELLKNIPDLAPNKLVYIKTSIKPGSVRVDFYSGKGIVNHELFDLNDEWEQLKEKGLGTKLIEW